MIDLQHSASQVALDYYQWLEPNLVRYITYDLPFRGKDSKNKKGIRPNGLQERHLHIRAIPCFILVTTSVNMHCYLLWKVQSDDNGNQLEIEAIQLEQMHVNRVEFIMVVKSNQACNQGHYFCLKTSFNLSILNFVARTHSCVAKEKLGINHLAT